MIKVVNGTIEINGAKPVIMAQTEELLRQLKKILGENDYNYILKNAEKSEEVLAEEIKKVKENISKNTDDMFKDFIKKLYESVTEGDE